MKVVMSQGQAETRPPPTTGPTLAAAAKAICLYA